VIAASPAGGALAAATHSPARTVLAVVLGQGGVITEPAVVRLAALLDAGSWPGPDGTR